MSGEFDARTPRRKKLGWSASLKEKAPPVRAGLGVQRRRRRGDSRGVDSVSVRHPASGDRSSAGSDAGDVLRPAAVLIGEAHLALRLIDVSHRNGSIPRKSAAPLFQNRVDRSEARIVRGTAARPCSEREHLGGCGQNRTPLDDSGSHQFPPWRNSRLDLPRRANGRTDREIPHGS
jgi:hypothetical protein